MERLTFISEKGTAGIEGMTEELVQYLPHAVYVCICKLREYEDTGLAPADVIWQKERLDSMIETLQRKTAYIERLENLLREMGADLPAETEPGDMTHYEWIRSLELEEMAELIDHAEDLVCRPCNPKYCDYYQDGTECPAGEARKAACRQATLKWLSSVVEESDESYD